MASRRTPMRDLTRDRRVPWGGWRRLAVRLRLVAPLLLFPCAAWAQEERLPQSALVGRVYDQVSGAPVAGAEIVLEGTTYAAVSDRDGGFRIEPLDAGRHVLRIRTLGYRDRVDSLNIPAGALLDVTVALSTQPIELDGIVVSVRSPVLERHGFYDRQRQGYGGVFIDRTDILEKRPSSVTDLFVNVRGLRVVWGGIYGARIFVNQRINFRDGDLPGCEPSVWLDGIRSAMKSFDTMRVEEIEGIEVYTRATAPGKFMDPCGTVAIWTRQRIR